MENINTAANIVTLIRLLLVPILLVLLYLHELNWFAILFMIGSLMDGMDGFLARKLKQETKFGTKFDSIADTGYLITVVILFLVLFTEELIAYKKILMPLAVLAGFHIIYSFIKFRTLTSYHLYSMKITVGTLYIFTIYSAVVGFNKTFFIATVILCYISAIENILISILLKQEKQNIKSVFHLKND